jgi:hypothetical protein
LASAASEITPEIKAQVQSNYSKLPLSFETNLGQTDAQVKFLTRGQGYALFLTPAEAVLNLTKPQAQTKDSPSLPSAPPEVAESVLRMELVGANTAPQILGTEALPGKVNYLIGNDPSQWLSGIPTYAKVVYEDVYPGVNLVYYGTQGRLEYDFVLAPGVNPDQVKLAFHGADNIEISPEGDLVLHSSKDEVRMRKPVIYQEFDGTKKPVEGSYLIMDEQTVGFQVASYDTAQPLIIDPVLEYSTFLGGGDNDTGFGIAVDHQGQAYVTGLASGGFPTVNALQPINMGPGHDFGDAFVAKFTADGSALIYSTYLGGSSPDQGRGIAVDQHGHAYVTGITESFDFPTKNALQPIHGNDPDGSPNNDADLNLDLIASDAFVAQLTTDGTALRFATFLGGDQRDYGARIAVDRRGQAYVTGGTGSTDFPTRNALQPALAGSSDAFIAQFTSNGRALRYATYLGGSESDTGAGIAVDGRGQAYVTGGTGSTDFPTRNALQPALAGSSDAFVAQFTSNGRALRYATYLGGSESDRSTDIAVDRRGQAYVTGETGSTDFPTRNALQPALAGSFDAFVTKLTTDGSSLHYSTYLGGSEHDVGLSIAVDGFGQAYVTGDTHSVNFPTVNAFQPVSVGSPFNAFVTKIIIGSSHSF